MKILMVIGQYYPIIGGAERQCQLQAEELARRGHCVRILTGRWTKSKRKEIINGVEIMRLDNLHSLFGIRSLANFSFCLVLFFCLVFSLKKFQIVHIHQGLRPAVVTLFALFFFKIPSLIKIANSANRNDYRVIKYGRESPIDRIFKFHYLLRRADIFVSLNKQISSELIEDGVLREKIIPIANGIKIEEIKVKDSYRFQGDFKLIYVGRITRHKGIEFLLEAISGCQDIKLDMFGNITGASYWCEKIDFQDLGKKVKFNGMVNNLSNVLCNYDLFVLPSLTEGMSNALLEAMATGIPCIVTNIPANTEVVLGNGNIEEITKGNFLLADCALFVNKNDAAGLKKAISYLQQNEGIRQELGKSARKRIGECFSIENIINKYTNIYETLVSKSNE